MNSLTQQELVGFKPFVGDSKEDRRAIQSRKGYALYIREDKALTPEIRRLLVDHFKGMEVKHGRGEHGFMRFDRIEGLDRLGSGYCSVVYEHPSNPNQVVKMFERYSSDVCCYEYLRMCADGKLDRFDWAVTVNGLAVLKVFKKGSDGRPDKMGVYAVAVMPKYRECSWNGNTIGAQNRHVQAGIQSELRDHVMPYLPQARIDLHWGNIMYDANRAAYIATDPVILQQGGDQLHNIPFPTNAVDLCKSLRPNEAAGKYINQLRQGIQHGRVW